MDARTIKNLLVAKPFEPFRVTMSSGERYEVRHPEMGWVAGSKLFIALPRNNGSVEEDAEVVFCSLLHISEVRTTNAA